jgi:hypothetical protein
VPILPGDITKQDHRCPEALADGAAAKLLRAAQYKVYMRSWITTHDNPPPRDGSPQCRKSSASGNGTMSAWAR